MRDRIALRQVGVLGSPSSQDGVAGRAFSIANPARDTPQTLRELSVCPLEVGAYRSVSAAAHKPMGERQPSEALEVPGHFWGRCCTPSGWNVWCGCCLGYIFSILLNSLYLTIPV